ncbi:MAG TPA: hypothetical protein GX711_01900 [Clostridia bacterium]|nr:hypothetical protein [Clostridia bacterium]
MDKLDLILNQMQEMNGKITTVETRMATKDDIAEIDTRLTNVETNMATKKDIAEIDTRLTNIETNMATKKDIAEIEARMATKDELAQIEARMATKDDIAEIDTRLTNVETNMATKKDIAEIEAKMATKDDIAELPYIRQAVLENSRSLVLLTETVQQISQTLARIEIEHGRKLSALFDLYQLHTEQLKRIEDRLNIHEEIIFQR